MRSGARMWRGWALLWAGMLCSACSTGDLVTAGRGDLDQPGDSAGDSAGGDLTGGDLRYDLFGDRDAGDQGSPVEVCDGFDNDGDGKIDEDLDGGACTTAGGDTGEMRCNRGKAECVACLPGETRVVSCPCGADTVDICDDDKRWMLGTCDGCSPETLAACDRYDACTPGDIEIRRCDTCEGEQCGTDCIGAQWQCNGNCQWVQLTQCQVYEETQCGQDDIKVEACGRCGERRVPCDGCFWTPEPCLDEGVCRPGESRFIPCADAECTPGFYKELVCNGVCEWQEPPTCNGCIPGIYDEIEECMAGYDCGTRTTRVTCTGQQISVCGGTEQMTLGHRSAAVVIQDDCFNLCTPGSVRDSVACTTGDGECGYRSDVCSDTCAWQSSSSCVARPEACIPGTPRQTSCNSSCDPSATYTETCVSSGCGWSGSSSGCPCVPGRTRGQSCTVADGRCGTITEVCDSSCNWVEQVACTANSWSCIPDTEETLTYSCGANACGIERTRTRTCNANGCGWSYGPYVGTCPSCQIGQTTTEDCTASGGLCGTRVTTCNSSTCEWNAPGACNPKPDACSPGAIDDRDCTAVCGLPGKERWVCDAGGCGWSLTQNCQPITPPECTPGQSESELCPGCQTTRTERTCSQTCEWSTWTDCPPCG